MHRALTAASSVALSLLLNACSQASVVRAPCPHGQICLEYGNASEPETLDPHLATGNYEARIIADLLVGLVQDDPEGRPIPGVAKDWSVSPAGLVWRFKLRDSIWSDGVPVTAQDFVFSFRRAIDPRTVSSTASLLHVIKNARAISERRLPVEALGVRATDSKTLEITLEHPTPFLLELAKHPIMMPVPAHQVRKFGDRWSEPGRFVSNGPYLLMAWKFGERVSVRRNPRFWAAKSVCFDEVRYYPTTDSVSAERRVLRGELDVNAEFQSNRIDFLSRTMPRYVRAYSTLSPVYLTFNLRDPVLRDVRVRQALAMSIDREFITEKLLRGAPLPAYSLIPPSTSRRPQSTLPHWSSWSLSQRQQEARRLLRDAGYTKARPLKVEIKYRNQRDPMAFMPAIQADWKEIGVQTSLAQNETQIAYASYRLGDFQIADAAIAADYNDPMAFLHLMESDGAQNYGGFKNRKFDESLRLASDESDPEMRSFYIARAESEIFSAVPVTPLYYSISRNLVSPDITGWKDNIGNQHRVRYLCRASRH
ncbi:peptide ABC transporter substrate-binding protein [Sphingosinicella rhizophila]|uniref:Peptide ABC transporter substrate-binding protein n=1 Tax=Sphingosinicella rhizophila TaxID=3050082 RepID=A0ABU3Q6H1_9SPHN|nr:peptide ABC transporter substrate-binding protein [Sphingosinicella sp. GR2756]MDT9598684.1 peptide ABC transporter substrate-binding protein [Sphingosinicella sp. GR2756]